MIIHAIADLHGHLPKLSSADVLILAGDLTWSGAKGEFFMLADWVERQDYEHIVVVAGNHDKYLAHKQNPFKRAHYLCDSGVEILGYKFWGMPYTPKFMNWHFMEEGDRMRRHVELIPEDTDILVTHGPPRHILDTNAQGYNCGCQYLRMRAIKVGPIAHVFGHIHEHWHKEKWDGQTRYINCSIMDETYTVRASYKTINL